MRKRVLQVTAGASLGLLIALLAVRPEPGAAVRPGEQFLLSRPLPAPDAELVAHTGDTVTLAELGREHTLVVFFGYTHCPDVCPLTMAALGRARELLGAERDSVRGVLITVDPERDTPEQLATFLSRFPSGLIGLTGSPAALEHAARGYLVTSQRTATAAPAGEPGTDPHAGHRAPAPAEGSAYLVEHTGRAYVVRAGEIPMTFPPLTDPAEMASGLKLLLDP